MAADKQSPIYPNLDKVEEYVNGIELNGKYLSDVHDGILEPRPCHEITQVQSEVSTDYFLGHLS